MLKSRCYAIKKSVENNFNGLVVIASYFFRKSKNTGVIICYSSES